MRSASRTRTFAITLAPAFAANWVAKEPTPPPAPTISTVLPASGSSKSTEASPAPPAVGSAAATTSSSPPGTRASGASSVTATYSAYVPAEPSGATWIGADVDVAPQVGGDAEAVDPPHA